MRTHAGFGLVLVAVLVVSLFVGAQPLSIARVWAGLHHAAGPEVNHIMWGMRIPRTLLAVAVGASLGISGLLAQVWTRNPLADPGIVGVTAGARFAIALGTTYGVAGGLGKQAVVALIGAVVATLFIVFVARKSVDPLTLILVGVGVNATLMALAMLLSLQSKSVFNDLRQWSVGSTVGRGFAETFLAGAGGVIAMIIGALVARNLDVLAFGHDSAAALGVNIPVTFAGVITAIAVAGGTATAAAGPIAFLGLAAPHMVRPCARSGGVRELLWPTACLGGILALAAAILGRVANYPGELEFSVVLAILGAPLMIYLVKPGARL
ncbi:FecCD family ABC transporter permease [Corynebacterium epidermidicanis]|uniref:ABC-type Fe3+-siderophore transport system, permease component n=1 Tax=Corynebacterium epidermidicanis TaxID=1050174 RepID=A0A0G3GT84_9CORY|nr:iron ABC transporter permease [Corynebacterium epidermidicanis]AKK03750.1 ABC-type Fe3+-siderophore transport system, permease component [Corynebacterium epidermidicanis]